MTELIIIPILHKRFFWRIQTIMTSHTWYWYRSQNYTLSLRKFVAAMSIMQNNGGFVYNTHLNNKIEEVVRVSVLPTGIISFLEKSQWLFPTIFFQIREWMIHFKSGLAVAQVIVGDLLFRNRNVIDCDYFKILEKNVKSLE